MRTTSRARVVIATAGTLGDLLPFVALGRSLVARGQEVVIACATGLHDWVERSGLCAAAFDGDFGMETAQRHAREWNDWDDADSDAPDRSTALARRIEENALGLAGLAREADLLLTPTNCPEGRLAHELSGTPWISVIFIPSDGLHDALDNTSDGEEGAFRAFLDPLRHRLGLPRTSCTSWREFGLSAPALLACSTALGRPASPDIRQTGFWFYDDPGWATWRPDGTLAQFMAGEPPLMLSFSSLPLEDPRRVLEVHARAAALLGRRLVVQQGWAGFTREMLPADVDPASVYMASFLPHDWFFARVAGLITHGGIGTLGRALRARCPLLLEPYGNDQFFNALLVKRLGYGAAMKPLRLTAESLAAVLRRSVLAAGARERLEAAAAVIAREDGVGSACDIIEQQLARRRGVA